jgi:hypothetical protein
MSFLGWLFRHTRTAIKATDWPQILTKIDEGLAALRLAWFGVCVSLVEEGFSGSGNAKIENKTLFGDAELTLKVYQLILACEFIAENQYVPPASGRDFTA